MEWEEGIEGRPHSLPGPLLSLLTFWVFTYITRAFRKIQHLDCVFKVMSSVGFHTNASGWLKHLRFGGKINFLCLSLEALESVALGWCADSAPPSHWALVWLFELVQIVFFGETFISSSITVRASVFTEQRSVQIQSHF